MFVWVLLNLTHYCNTFFSPITKCWSPIYFWTYQPGVGIEISFKTHTSLVLLLDFLKKIDSWSWHWVLSETFMQALSLYWVQNWILVGMWQTMYVCVPNSIISSSAQYVMWWSCTIKLGEEKSKYVWFGSGKWFCHSIIAHTLPPFAKRRSNPVQLQKKSVINWIWLLLSVSDRPIIIIGPGGLLLVVPPPICCPCFSFIGGVGKKRWIIKLGCEKYLFFAGVAYWGSPPMLGMGLCTK